MTDYNPFLFAYGFFLALAATLDWMDWAIAGMLFGIIVFILVEIFRLNK